jgi:hypothetical protein
MQFLIVSSRMKFLQICTVLLLVCLMVERGNCVRACGKQLVQAMSLVCDGQFRGYGKRFDNNLIGYLWSQNWQDVDETHQGLMQHKSKRGIVEECCYQSCSMENMRLYCDN